MILNLYKTVDNDNVINKTLTDKLSVEIFLTAQTNIINPTIPLSEIPNINLYDYNYCEIPTLKRFYSVDSIDNINAKIFVLQCSCDVLMTYKNEILNSSARLMRSIKTGDYYNGDTHTNVNASVSTHISSVTLDSTPSLILTTVGNK